MKTYGTDLVSGEQLVPTARPARAKDMNGAKVMGTLAGGGPGVVRLTHVFRQEADGKSWNWAGCELLVDASTVEVLC